MGQQHDCLCTHSLVFTHHVTDRSGNNWKFITGVSVAFMYLLYFIVLCCADQTHRGLSALLPGT